MCGQVPAEWATFPQIRDETEHIALGTPPAPRSPPPNAQREQPPRRQVVATSLWQVVASFRPQVAFGFYRKVVNAPRPQAVATARPSCHSHPRSSRSLQVAVASSPQFQHMPRYAPPLSYIHV